MENNPIANLILWEKYRPTTLDDMVLPPMIKKLFPDRTVNGNYIFYGSYGTGKTTLARILIGKYSDDRAFLEINSSLYTSIDMLRGEIERFCRTVPMMVSDNDVKYVFLDEFERVSPQYQDAFKAFVEQYHDKVRFILTTNHISRVSEGILSRFKTVCFDPTPEELPELKKQLVEKLHTGVITKESIDISEDTLRSIINRKYPDVRAMMVEIQSIKITGMDTMTIGNVNEDLKIELYRTLFRKNMTYLEIYDFLMVNFGPDNMGSVIDLLGRPFVLFLRAQNKYTEMLFEANGIVTKYRPLLESRIDPIILGMTVIGEMRNLFISK